jgi:hypothetical protein
MLARRLGAQIGRSFSEVVHQLYLLNDDVEAVRRHFAALDVEPVQKRAAGAPEPEPEPPEPEPEPEPEPIVAPAPIWICKSEGELIVVDPPMNGAAALVSRGVLAPATIVTARGVRTVYASPGFARYLSAVCGEEQERDDFRC